MKNEVDALDRKVEIATERFDVARSKHTKLLGEKKRAGARVAKAEKRLNQLQTHLDTRANDMYRTGQLGFLDVLLGAKTYEQFARTWDLLKQLNASDADYIAQTKVARAEARAAHADLAAKEKAAAKQLSIMTANKKSIESQLADRKRKLAGIEAQVVALQAQEEAARAASARAWLARTSGGDRSWPTPTIPAHGDVVDYARSRLGCRYVWGADGPNTFDCSGLTMWCYRQVGISLPHSSAAQIHEGQRVSRGDLAPGDLVFFGSPIHHVGLYIGGGMMIHAPHSGDVVKISSINRGDYAGACRP